MQLLIIAERLRIPRSWWVICADKLIISPQLPAVLSPACPPAPPSHPSCWLRGHLCWLYLPPSPTSHWHYSPVGGDCTLLVILLLAQSVLLGIITVELISIYYNDPMICIITTVTHVIHHWETWIFRHYPRFIRPPESRKQDLFKVSSSERLQSVIDLAQKSYWQHGND